MTPSSSSSSSSSGGSHAAGLAIAATAMALSGTLVLYSLCRAKQPQLQVPSDDAPSSPRLRPCLSSSEKRKKKKRELARRGSQKRVRFADDVVDKDNGGGGGTHATREAEAEPSCAAALRTPMAANREAEAEPSCAAALRTPMPANREALYRGMLRGRSMLRVTCSY